MHGADEGCGSFGLEDEGATVEGEFVRAGGDDFACGVGVERGVYLLDLCRGEASGTEYFVEGVLGRGLLLQSVDGDGEGGVLSLRGGAVLDWLVGAVA